MESSKVVGEGTYGCVHKPPLNCGRESSQPPNTVTKLMKETAALTELAEYSVMKIVDPKDQYYLGTPRYCGIRKNPYNVSSAEQCKTLLKNDPKLINHLSKYSLLVMGDGGDDLTVFAKKAKEWSGKERFEKIDRFWLAAHQMFVGIKAFLENGVIHHDLKGQNIVYNEETHRMNFIDFGLMIRKEGVINECTKSKYGFSVFHWSFPLECRFLNKDNYDQIAGYSEKEKDDFVKEIMKRLKKKESSSSSDAVRYFLHYAANERGSVLNKGKMMSHILKHFRETIMQSVTPGEPAYDKMVNKCLDTFDLYGLALALMCVLRDVHSMMDVKMVAELESLFMDMTDANVLKRVSIDTAITRYETILEKYQILKKYNMHFKDHALVEGAAVLEKKIEEVAEKSPAVSPKEIKELLAKDPEALEPKPTEIKAKKEKKDKKVIGSACPEGKERNPKTQRCVNKCKPGEERNERFECRKTQRKWKKRKE